MFPEKVLFRCFHSSYRACPPFMLRYAVDGSVGMLAGISSIDILPTASIYLFSILCFLDRQMTDFSHFDDHWDQFCTELSFVLFWLDFWVWWRYHCRHSGMNDGAVQCHSLLGRSSKGYEVRGVFSSFKVKHRLFYYKLEL